MQPGSNPLGTRPDQAGRKSKQWLAGSLKRLKEKRAMGLFDRNKNREDDRTVFVEELLLEDRTR
jgi:hypothetical protein